MSFEFAVFAVCDVFEPSFFAPFFDVALDGFGVETHRGGEFAVGLAVEFFGEGFEVVHLPGLPLCCGGGRGRGDWCGECPEDSLVVADDDSGNGLGGGVVGVGAGDALGETAVFHYAEGGEYHRDAEGDDSEATDCGDEVVSAGGCVLVLPTVEEFVEVLFLSGGEAEPDVGLESGEDGVEVAVFFSPDGKLVFERVVLRVGEDIVPNEPGVEAVV